MRKILIVDDEFHVTEGLKAMINWDRLKVDQVLIASDGLEALDIYMRELPDLVLTDVSMPKMNGLQLASKIRELDAKIPILMLSGYDDFEYAREALHLHATKYLLKPTIFTEIEEALQETLVELKETAQRNEYMDQFIEQMKQHVPVLREQFLYNLVTTGKSGQQSEESALAFYDLNSSVLSGALIVCVALYRPNHERAANEKDWQLFKYAAVNIIEELSGMLQIPAFVLRYVEDRLIILIEGVDSHETDSKAAHFGEELIHQVTSKLEVDLNVGIGRWCADATEYPLSYHESLESLKWIEYEGINKVGRAKQFKDVQDYVPEYSMERIKLLFNSIRNHEVKEAFKHWAEIESELKQAETPLYYVQNLCVSLISRMMLELFPEEQPLIGNLHLTVKDIYRTHSIETILSVVRELLQNLLDSMKLQYSAHQEDGYIRKIGLFVEENYHQNISFADLAKQLHLTRNYLSYLFKKEKGISFMTYLTAFRIQKAKELLRTRKHLVYEVAEKVGYSDAAYFSRVFKNATGTTPADYVLGINE